MSAQANFTLRGRNPDVLSCIANLSNDEVFTPPELANRMLDTLAEAWAANHGGANIWADKTVRFLDPCTKSGVFLREITSRLTVGLAQEIPDLQQRVNHILTQQVFGIAITQLTSLLARRSVYCSKQANGEHSVVKSFDNDEGNIWFERTEHAWDGDKCHFCGAARAVFDRAAGLETHAYAFIHTENIRTRLAGLFGGEMQFDVIIGNPPYQLASDGGTRDVPIYQHFVEQAKRLEPRYLSMVIPSRWMASGLGLSDFRKGMLDDRRIRKLVDYERMDEVFPGVDFEGGVCFFLWDRDHTGNCEVTTVSGDQAIGPFSRALNEFDILVRDSRGVDILKKVSALGAPSIIEILSADKEFGWTSNYDGFNEKKKASDVALYYFRGGKRLVGGIAQNLGWLKTQRGDRAVTTEDLPPELKQRYLSKNGKVLIEVEPSVDVWERKPTEEFVGQLQSVVPEATGTPVMNLEYIDLLMESYVQAAFYAAGVVVILIFLLFRRIKDVLLTLLPLAVGILWMFGLLGLLKIQLNPANIVTLPMILGIGVAFGVYVVARYREEGKVRIFESSTGKAVVLSALTTLFGFGSMLIGEYRGLVSLGMVMSLGVLCTLVSAIGILPQILSLLDRSMGEEERDPGP
ncbi:MAG: hypothetical protein EBU81_07810 [Proteobacteria bacterium]|nr:hypothetical protein [Pseudomonadota bacterium]